MAETQPFLKKRRWMFSSARLLWLYSAIMVAVWGVSGRGMSTWPIFAVIYFFFGLFSRPRPSKSPDTFLTSPKSWLALAVFAAVHSTLIPVIERW